MALTISIHPMLRFNWLFTCTCSSEICISIHPMLRFNIAKHHPHSSKVEYFNTSYVTVQRNRPAVLAQAVQISIHPMLRFNGFLLFSSIPPGEFQYILCYGSTLLLNPLKFLNKLFQYILCYGSTKIKFLGFLCQVYFNTSYVTVQLQIIMTFIQHKNISIHPMLRFNVKPNLIICSVSWFQYILCYGSTENKISGIPLPEPFQYILCYGSTTARINNNYYRSISIHPMLRFNFFLLVDIDHM